MLMKQAAIRSGLNLRPVKGIRNTSGKMIQATPFHSSGNITASETGIYNITVYDEYNCRANDTMKLVVFPVPEVDFLGPTQVCGTKTTSIHCEVHTGAADSIWNFENSIRWSAGNPSILLTDTTHTSANIEVSEWGEYEIYYHLKTIHNCEQTDTLKIRFYPQPTSTFEFDSNEACAGYNQIVRYTGTASEGAHYNWDLNGSQFIDTLGPQTYLVTLGVFLDEPPSIGLSINDNGCLSDTTIKTSGAVPNFKMNASPTRGCDDLTVNFTGEMLTDDNVEYQWKFHDGLTETDSEVTRIYSEPGFYKVSLTVVNPVSQCINSFTADSLVRIFPTPEAEILADPGICYPDTLRLIYGNAIDSSLCYWEFENMHQAGGSNDSITAVFDSPTATVTLVVEEYGCISEPTEMQLRRKPLFDFQTNETFGCQPFSAEIFAETADNNIQFEWLSDSILNKTVNPGIFNTSDWGNYNIGLIAHSLESGCADTLIREEWLSVNPTPEANIRIDYPVAMIENARIKFTNRTPDADYFTWDFGDGTFSEEYHSVHTYTEPGEYLAKLIAETTYGCLDTAGVTITVLPSAVFTPNAFRPSSPVEENRTFMPVTEGIDPYRFKLSVYNRQGRLIFETESPNKAWDGNMPDGRPALMGNYIWIARFFDIQGIEREQKGQVLLIR
jgi:PKD repeat protein